MGSEYFWWAMPTLQERLVRMRRILIVSLILVGQYLGLASISADTVVPRIIGMDTIWIAAGV